MEFRLPTPPIASFARNSGHLPPLVSTPVMTRPVSYSQHQGIPRDALTYSMAPIQITAAKPPNGPAVIPDHNGESTRPVPDDILFSTEQRTIAETLREGKNIIVDSVAGSGKTTAIRCIAETLPRLNILAVLYNRGLADESQAKLAGRNVKVRTIHSAAGGYYGVPCTTDQDIENILLLNAPYHGIQFDILVVDEAQDLTPILVKMIRKLLRDCQAKQMVVMGDYQQCIYAFKGSDERFLTMADTFFSDCLPVNTWVHLTLSQTFRCTESVVNFVNVCLLGNSRLISRKSGAKPKYMVCNAFKCGQDINHEIDLYLQQGNSFEDIAILAPSIREKSVIAKVANYLSGAGKPIFIPSDDDISIRDNQLLRGKVVFSTFHQFKGRERKMIIVMNFDDSYFRFYNKDESRDVCPNQIYVATTRSSDRLILVQHSGNGVFPFLNLDHLANLVEVVGRFPVFAEDERNQGVKDRVYAVSNVIKFLPHSFLESIKDLWTVTTITQPGNLTEIDSIVRFEQTSEDVSSIYGTSVPIFKQWRLQGYLILFDAIDKLRGYAEDLNLETEVTRVEQLKKITGELPLEDLAWMINLYMCILDRYVHPLKQILRYDWFVSNMPRIEECIRRLDFLTPQDSFEVPIDYQTRIGETGVSILGAIDCIHNDQVWEFKLVREFNEAHIIQVVVYACMWCIKNGGMKESFLFNTRTGETLQIKIEPQNASVILDRIIGHKVRSGDRRKTLPELIASTQ